MSAPEKGQKALKNPSQGRKTAKRASRMGELAISNRLIPLSENVSHLSHLAMSCSDHP